MKRYFVKTPWWLKKLYSSYVWDIKTDKKILYLTFDDGPHPQITNFVLDTLKNFDAKATFFCIGKNVKSYPDVFNRILAEDHSVGNHTYNHLNGWKTKNEDYFKDIADAEVYIKSELFRPPYGRITSRKAQRLSHFMNVPKAKIIMWDVLSADFDSEKTPEQVYKNVTSNASPGSIIVFHDSEKAFPRLKTTLPMILKHFSEKGFYFRCIK